jgi:hypothetical protein
MTSDGCEQETYETQTPVTLLLVPYKTISFMEPSSQDAALHRQLCKIISRNFRKQGHVTQEAKREFKEAKKVLRYIVLADVDLPIDGQPDFQFLDIICSQLPGIDGFVRFVEDKDSPHSIEPHCFDEVAVCSAGLSKLKRVKRISCQRAHESSLSFSRESEELSDD